MQLMPFVLVALVFYVFIIRPQHTKMKQHRRMLENLKENDSIATVSGICAIVLKPDIGDNQALVEIADNVHVKLQREAIISVKNKKDAIESERNTSSKTEQAEVTSHSSEKTITKDKS